ncbi:deoxyribodipyrimidine photo-lyase [Vibrio tapetis subsp. quintayensis]|uniref:deoxyribodipyrimidine photo-lyase n=1 Tax=Vibrio tapetis TaxID=52443 RepID=UPI0025B5A797|nr:deoxyribodipyrimidine photo-lyase [Vibrio tapetis]MDN3682847.1 deoxyribodipyrimidine photo-lyase [Vibrio tapetis subsp. quintayensis]
MSPLLWLRRDLRIHDNPALCSALNQGATEAVFISTPHQWRDHNMAPVQADFIKRHLVLVANQLIEFGITLVHLQAKTYQDQVAVLEQYCQDKDYQTVMANREPEINELKRDEHFANTGIALEVFECDTILPVGTVRNKQDDMFKVFTPFKRVWLQKIEQYGVTCFSTPSIAHTTNDPKTSNAERFEFDYPCKDSSRWPLSDVVMSSVVPHFLDEKVADYATKRDFPNIKATSGLSPYLAIGAISPRWLATQLIQQHPELIYDTNVPSFAWLNELIWRDFYKHLLFRYPNLAKGESFQEKYRHMHWRGNPDHFQAWCDGRTGYPLVDAAMRQLIQTGWMHNRLRMVVASFLTKHLLIDWRQGEQFFMSQLIDGDLSANNGGWQWASSTGCDAQPYFRIFNPITQSKKFDPNGDFIRRYVPELRDIPDKQIHFPHDYLAKFPLTSQYWPPIVEHKEARLKALGFFKQSLE